MRTSTMTVSAATVGVLAIANATSAQILFQDDFENPAGAANYTTVTAAAGGDVATYGYAYSTEASRSGLASDARTGNGLLFETNDAITNYINGIVLDGSQPISIRYDMYLQWASGGSTEYGVVGAYGTAAEPFFESFSGSASDQGTGVWANAASDGDFASQNDYRLSERLGTGSTTLLDNADADGDDSPGNDGSDLNNLPSTFPGGGTSWLAGTPGWHWTEVELIVDGSNVEYYLEGNLILSGTYTGPTTGLIGIGLADPFPSANNSGSLGDGSGTNMIIDNLVVAVIPEPASLSLLGLGGLAMLRRRR